MTIAGWLLVLEPGQAGSVRAALQERPGIDCRSEHRGTLVVVTETAAHDASLEELRRELGALPGVREAVLVTRFEDEGEPAQPSDSFISTSGKAAS